MSGDFKLAQAGKQAKRQLQVSQIMELMKRGEWQSSMISQLAAEWGISEGSVRLRSAEASRNVRGAFEVDRDQIRAWALNNLKEIVPEARAAEQFSAAVAAVRETADIVGIKAPVQHEIKSVVASMTTDGLMLQLEELQRRAAAAIAAEKHADVELLEEPDEAPQKPAPVIPIGKNKVQHEIGCDMGEDCTCGAEPDPDDEDEDDDE